jgi:hypothetical protein
MNQKDEGAEPFDRKIVHRQEPREAYPLQVAHERTSQMANPRIPRMSDARADEL